MRWFFRFNVGECKGSTVNNAHGIGHAVRCAALAAEIKRSGLGEVYCQTNDEEAAVDFCRREGLERVSDPRLISPDVVVLDINYLEAEQVLSFKDLGFVVNLAPRGLGKAYADLTFLDFPISDGVVPEHNSQWFVGEQYVVLNSEFSVRFDKSELPDRENLNRIVISMGGSDPAEMTLPLLEAAAGLTATTVRIVIPPVAPQAYKERLRRVATALYNIEIREAPTSMLEVFEGCELGLFSAGLTTYEALSVGLPSVNLSITDFHADRIRHLCNQRLCIDGGRWCSNEDAVAVIETTASALGDKALLKEIGAKGSFVVDGAAPSRICRQVLSMISVAS